MDNNRNNAPENELNIKQVFSDAPIKPSERPIAPIQLPSDDENTELPAFDKPTVFDERFAARQAERPRPEASRRPPRPAPTTPRRRTRHAAPGPRRLFSGETISDAARRIIRELCVLLLFALLVSGGFWLKGAISDFLTNDTYASLAQSTVDSEAVRCRGIELESTTLPDGYAAAQAVCTQLGQPITDRSAFTKTEEEIIFPSEVSACMADALSDGEVQVRSGLSNRELLTRIHENLRANKPVIVLLAESDAAGMRLQYAVVNSMNAERDAITVISPLSGEIRYTLEDFIAATRFSAYKKMPFQVKLGLTFGSLSRNTAIFVE